MSFLHHSSRGRHAVDEQPADDERIDGEEPATATDGQEPAGGQATERPRYAFGYAPDDVAEDDAVDGNVVRGDVVREDGDYPPVTVSDVPADTGAARDGAATDRAGTTATPAAAAPTVGVPAMEADRGAGVTDTPVPAPRSASEYEPATDAEPTPTFEPAGEYQPTPTFEPADEYQPTPTFEPADGYGTAAEYEPGARETAAAGTGLDEPLLADSSGLRARWQQAQANFVDDPRTAVTDAAALVEQTAQALIDGLERRQRQLRQQWERGQAGDPNAPAGEPSDTERLRLTMQRYRALFDQLCVR